MGLSESDAYSTIRFATSVLNSEAEMNTAANLVVQAYRGLKR
jgi:cysteine sulfinate desulfinase/cysteine desulfurase-like protein